MALIAFDGLADVQRREYVDMMGLEPIMQSFGGKTATENLVNGMNAALGILKKYTSTLTFDPNRANELFDRIEVWQSANGERLRQLMRQGAKTVPEQLAIEFGPSEARSFIVASFAEASRGLKGWVGGAVAKNYRTNPNFTEAMALADRESRMITFASIVKLDQIGTLQKIFSPSAMSGDDALGIAPAVVAIVIGVAAAIAAIAVLATEAMRQSNQNKLIDKLCEKSESDCVAALKEAVREESQGSPIGKALTAGTAAFGKWIGVGVIALVGWQVLSSRKRREP